MSTNKFNFGKLKGKVQFEKNLVYCRRGLNELSLNINNACPNSCVFCIRDRDAGWGVSNLYLLKEPTVKEITNAFDSETKKIRDSGVKLTKVKICGYGEPMLRFHDLFPILAHIKHTNPRALIQLTTTGWPFFRYFSKDISKIKDLKNGGLTDVYLSISTPNKEVYKKIVRPGIDNYDPLAFDDTIRFCIAARDVGLKVTLGFIDIAGLKEKDAKEFAEKLNVSYKIRKLEK
ncbi:MAG: radical SAM protein [Candidatus Pacearchaeota archaeon]|nr:radical SAM protein [Candidatus Pacearchaeota archaeon]